MKLDPEIMRQLMLMFKAELDDQSRVITDGLLMLEKGISGKEREACLDRIFRAAHNIKGAARGVDVRDVASISHRLETLFSKLRQQDFVVNAEFTNLCLLAVDRMQSIIPFIESDQLLDFDLQALLDQLDGWKETADEVGVVHADTESQPEPEQLAENEPDISNPLDHEFPQNDVPVLPEGAKQVSEDISVIRILSSKLDQLSALVEDLSISTIEMENHLSEIGQLQTDSLLLHRLWVKNYETLKRVDISSRTTMEDDLLNTLGLMIKQFRVSTQKLYKQVRDSNNRSRLSFSQLQDQVWMMQLVPAATQLQPLIRSVRDIAQELGKKINFEVFGDEIEIDRPVLEGIKDPLMHLLRNAIDHGIESPQERRANGKPEIGYLSLTVKKLSDRVMIIVSDDGAGINADRIAQSAVKKKLLTNDEISGMSISEKINLIFLAGFSSKETITDISGRGVGLDVVLSNVQNLKGSVTVDTVEGKGTSFILSLPLTLSTDHGLMVRVSGIVFAIPISSVQCVLEVNKDQLVNIGGKQAVLVEKRPIPVCDLAIILELERRQSVSPGKLPFVVISKGLQHVAMLVDEIISEREIVIKRLRPPLKSVRNVIGAAFLGGNEVVTVLNPKDLVSSAMQIKDAGLFTDTQAERIRKPQILIVDDSNTIRTFEKSILEANGYQVTVAVDGPSAWELLQQQDFDLIMTDVEMPVMNGFELTERIKRSERFGKIPVVIVSSLASKTEQQQGIEAGADAYVVKGQFESGMLLDIVNQLV